MKYHHNFNDRKRTRFIHRIEFLIGIGIVLIAVIAIGFYVAAARDESANQSDQAKSSSNTAYYAANVQIFRTPFFQFQTDKSWSEATNESKDGKYVYRSMKNSLIKHELIVYTGGSVPGSVPVTRVLPVNVVSENSLKSGAISDHCAKLPPVVQKAGVRPITYQNVTFDCYGDSPQYTAVLGQVGGTPKLSLLRPNGEKLTYTIYYSNVTATPEASQLQQIVATFQTR